MRRRKKARVVWLPSDINNRLNVAPSPATADRESNTIIKIFTGNPLGATAVTEEIPIVKDFAGAPGQFVTNVNNTLADIEESGYRLRRIVGKLCFLVQQVADDAEAATIIHVTAGFIVRRVREGISTASLASGPGDEINPANLQNVMDPWIWRRSWLLSNQLGLDPNALVLPGSNTQYGGGNLDGPHVDAKTARIIGPEERLFLSVCCEGMNGTAQGAPAAILMTGDLRVLASMRTNVGNRRNASR